jgi:uncharacterized OB-fold protein
MSEEQPTNDDLTFNDWQDALREHQLLGQTCTQCGHVMGLPRGACDHCGSRNLSTKELPTTGKVYSESKVHVAPEGFKGGYRLALVDLGDARLLGRVEGDAGIGDTVSFSGIFDANGEPSPVFKLVD